ncbi:hypothetical protein SAMN05519104_2839 [Rhizobiales bacterium GAS188]|nr:hypothetical protein SAMN05519104_2839 [Rhizobiales bacterium GAS188]
MRLTRKRPTKQVAAPRSLIEARLVVDSGPVSTICETAPSGSKPRANHSVIIFGGWRCN